MASFNMRLWLLGAGLGLAALASSGTSVVAEARSISDVEVQQEGDVTRVILRGVEEPIYTAFMLEDPLRLIVELPEVATDEVTSPISVANGLVKDVTVGTFGDANASLAKARVSIALQRPTEYTLVPNGQELAIELRPGAEPAQTTAFPKAVNAVQEAPSSSHEAPAAHAESGLSDAERALEPESEAPVAKPEAEHAAEHEAAPEAAPAVEQLEAPAALHKEEPVAPAPAAAVSRIVGVTAGSEQVEIRAEGELDDIDSFTLDNPPRVVVDFKGVENRSRKTNITVGEGSIDRVRVGTHSDKVRLVVDLRGPVTNHSVEPSPNGAIVRVSADLAHATSTPAPALAEAEAHAPAADEHAAESLPAVPERKPESRHAESVPAAAADSESHEPAQAGDATNVLTAHFESLPAADRVILTLDHPVQAEMVQPDAATLIVRLPGTRIDSSAERRVDTREFGGPVEIFSVFQTPDVSVPEVRVVLKRSSAVPAELVWDGNQLRVQLARGADAPAHAGEPAAAADEHAAAGPDAHEAAPAEHAPAAPAEHAPAAHSPVPHAPAAGGAPAAGADDPFAYAGPSEPAAIDVLEEGGFSEEKEYAGRRISLDFKDADIGNILRLIAEVSDLNVIAGEEVSGKVTIRLVDVPWDQALDVILLTKGLGFVRIGNVLRIAPIETIKLESEARLQDRRAREKLEDLVVKLQPVNYAGVKDVMGLVKRLLSSRGSVDQDARTNTLIIKDIPSVVQEAVALVKAVDTQTPQVLIEAKIVEANLTFSRSLGAVWAFGYNPQAGRGGAEDLRFTNGSDVVPIFGDGEQQNNFLSANPLTDAPTGLLNLGLMTLDDHLQLDLQLQAAETNSKGKVISSPRVVTIDNKKASIKQGVAIAFTEATSDRITTSFVDAVLELNVTPHITADRSIIMNIKVSRNAPQLSASNGTITGIAKNETETEALVRDGETIVLGGIYVVDTGRSTSKVPYLADIPLLGAAFRNKSDDDARRELLIFVTPRVILGRPSDI